MATKRIEAPMGLIHEHERVRDRWRSLRCDPARIRFGDPQDPEHDPSDTRGQRVVINLAAAISLLLFLGGILFLTQIGLLG